MIKTFYRQNLPHIQPTGAAFFVTFRLDGSLPPQFIQKIKLELEAKVFEIKTTPMLHPEAEIYHQQKLFFKKYDEALDLVYNGVDYLCDPKIAKIVANKIHQFDGQLYELICYCIMPNHVHLVIDTSIQVQGKSAMEIDQTNYIQLDKILKLIKGGSAYEIHKILDRTGRFWQKESYDHFARNGKELVNIIWYVLKNPIKAQLVEDWMDYEFTYWKDRSGQF